MRFTSDENGRHPLTNVAGLVFAFCTSAYITQSADVLLHKTTLVVQYFNRILTDHKLHRRTAAIATTIKVKRSTI